MGYRFLQSHGKFSCFDDWLPSGWDALLILTFAMLVLLGSRSRESIGVYLLARSMSSLDLGLSPWATVLQEEPLTETLFWYSTVGTS